MRSKCVSPRRDYRRGQGKREDLEWVAEILDEEVTPEQLTAERRVQRRLPFVEVIAELREHCGLADWEIAKRLGVANTSLLRRMDKYGVRPTPEFVEMCTTERRLRRESLCV